MNDFNVIYDHAKHTFREFPRYYCAGESRNGEYPRKQSQEAATVEASFEWVAIRLSCSEAANTRRNHTVSIEPTNMNTANTIIAVEYEPVCCTEAARIAGPVQPPMFPTATTNAVPVAEAVDDAR